MTPYEKRVRELEEEGLTTSDAQAISDMEFEAMNIPDYYLASSKSFV
jgi:hypothetical protein